MNRISAYSATLLLAVLTSCSGSRSAFVTDDAVSGQTPDHVMLNLTENPMTSMAVTWRTEPGIAEGMVEYAETTRWRQFEKHLRTVSAATETVNGVGHPANYHSAVMTGLEPAKTYVYRVGDEKHKSEWFQFRTPPDTGPYSFIYFGDAQNDIKSLWSRVIREAYRQLPEAGFMLHAGDLINNKNNTSQWDEWFEAGGWLNAMVPSVMTPGNHEYFPIGDLSKLWRPQFTLPENGPEGLEETCYFTVYRDMLLISLNTMEGLRNADPEQPQVVWLRKVLEQNRQPWIVVTMHHPLYATKPGRDNDALRSNLQPLFEEFGVDLVLQGHDHAYGRGHNVMEGATVEAGNAQVMYVVSVSGPKMYELEPEEWMTRKARNTQLFQLITIDGDTLRYEAYTATGELYDAFEIRKANGKKTILQDVPDLEEYLD